MKRRGGGKHRAVWGIFSCFSLQLVGDANNGEERQKTGSKASTTASRAKNVIVKTEQGLSRDSQSRLEAYLGQQGLHALPSDSMPSQTAHIAATERRLTGLDDQIPCNSDAPPSRLSLDSLSVKPPSAPLNEGPPTPSKLLNHVSGHITTLDDSEASKTSHIHDATPTASDSDRSQETVSVLADLPPPSCPVAAPFYQTRPLTTPFDSAFQSNSHALYPSRSSHSLTSAAESMFAEGSVKLEALAPAPSYHTTIRTISITLSSATLDVLAPGIDRDAVPIPSSSRQNSQLGRHQRAKTMPHLHHSNNHEEFYLVDDTASVDGGISVKSMNSQHTRRHTAIVLLSEDENEEEGEEVEKVEEAIAAAQSSSSDSLLATSSSSSSSAGSRRGSRSMRRRLSEVYEGHHIPLQKLREQMGNPEDPPGDLLSLMARRVFSQQDIMSRVNSEGLISVLDAHSSFNTPSQQERPETSQSHDWLLESRITSLPRIRTQVVEKSK